MYVKIGKKKPDSYMLQRFKMIQRNRPELTNSHWYTHRNIIETILENYVNVQTAYLFVMPARGYVSVETVPCCTVLQAHKNYLLCFQTNPCCYSRLNEREYR